MKLSCSWCVCEAWGYGRTVRCNRNNTQCSVGLRAYSAVQQKHHTVFRHCCVRSAAVTVTGLFGHFAVLQNKYLFFGLREKCSNCKLKLVAAIELHNCTVYSTVAQTVVILSPTDSRHPVTHRQSSSCHPQTVVILSLTGVAADISHLKNQRLVHRAGVRCQVRSVFRWCPFVTMVCSSSDAGELPRREHKAYSIQHGESLKSRMKKLSKLSQEQSL